MVLLCGALAGCRGSALETGYSYRPLSDTAAERRAYYAAPYSPESKVAPQDRSDEFRSRRATNY